MNIYCFRKSKHIMREIICRRCLFRRKCRPFQLWLEPELPLSFKPHGDYNGIFDLQNDVQNSLNALYPSERRLLERRALKSLSRGRDAGHAIVRLKMFELMQNSGR